MGRVAGLPSQHVSRFLHCTEKAFDATRGMDCLVTSDLCLVLNGLAHSHLFEEAKDKQKRCAHSE